MPSFFQSWSTDFKNIQNGAKPGSAYSPPPSLVPQTQSAQMQPTEVTLPAVVKAQVPSPEMILKHLAVYSLIRSFQVNCENILF